MCEFCRNYDFSNVKAIVDEKGRARIVFADSRQHKNNSPFSFCPCCGERLSNAVATKNTAFTHICKSDLELYPSAFACWARIIAEDENTVTFERFMKYGALPVGKATVSRKDFERYYRVLEDEINDG